VDPISSLALLALGFAVGWGAGVLRTLRQAARRRAIAGVASALIALWPESLPRRSAADMIAGRINLFLGGELYELHVLPGWANAKWSSDLDAAFTAMLADLDDPAMDREVALSRLLAESDRLWTFLRSYDHGGVLPDELPETATDVQILRAAVEVWLAANPKAGARPPTGPETSGNGPALPSILQPPTDGALPSSGDSPTSRSSATTTPPPSASAIDLRPTSSGSSRPSGSGPSSRTTRKPTGAGKGRNAAAPANHADSPASRSSAPSRHSPRPTPNTSLSTDG